MDIANLRKRELKGPREPLPEEGVNDENLRKRELKVGTSRGISAFFAPLLNLRKRELKVSNCTSY